MPWIIFCCSFGVVDVGLAHSSTTTMIVAHIVLNDSYEQKKKTVERKCSNAHVVLVITGLTYLQQCSHALGHGQGDAGQGRGGGQVLRPAGQHVACGQAGL